jgi:hypothetical protein
LPTTGGGRVGVSARRSTCAVRRPALNASLAGIGTGTAEVVGAETAGVLARLAAARPASPELPISMSS